MSFVPSSSPYFEINSDTHTTKSSDIQNDSALVIHILVFIQQQQQQRVPTVYQSNIHSLPNEYKRYII